MLTPTEARVAFKRAKFEYMASQRADSKQHADRPVRDESAMVSRNDAIQRDTMNTQNRRSGCQLTDD